MNWKELKDFCNKLPESFLKEKVIMWREDECINNIDARQLEEDYYIDPERDDNGCYPEFEAIEKINMNPEDYPDGLEDLKKCYVEGFPILEEDN